MNKLNVILYYLCFYSYNTKNRMCQQYSLWHIERGKILWTFISLCRKMSKVAAGGHNSILIIIIDQRCCWIESINLSNVWSLIGIDLSIFQALHWDCPRFLSGVISRDVRAITPNVIKLLLNISLWSTFFCINIKSKFSSWTSIYFYLWTDLYA